MDDYLLKNIPAEDHFHLKASEMRNIREKFTSVAVFLGLLIATAMAFFVALTSYFIWDNKFTLFITIITGGILGCCAMLYGLTAKELKKETKKVRLEVEKRKLAEQV